MFSSINPRGQNSDTGSTSSESAAPLMPANPAGRSKNKIARADPAANRTQFATRLKPAPTKTDGPAGLAPDDPLGALVAETIGDVPHAATVAGTIATRLISLAAMVGFSAEQTLSLAANRKLLEALQGTGGEMFACQSDGYSSAQPPLAVIAALHEAGGELAGKAVVLLDKCPNSGVMPLAFEMLAQPELAHGLYSTHPAATTALLRRALQRAKSLEYGSDELSKQCEAVLPALSESLRTGEPVKPAPLAVYLKTLEPQDAERIRILPKGHPLTDAGPQEVGAFLESVQLDLIPAFDGLPITYAGTPASFPLDAILRLAELQAAGSGQDVLPILRAAWERATELSRVTVTRPFELTDDHRQWMMDILTSLTITSFISDRGVQEDIETFVLANSATLGARRVDRVQVWKGILPRLNAVAIEHQAALLEGRVEEAGYFKQIVDDACGGMYFRVATVCDWFRGLSVRLLEKPSAAGCEVLLDAPETGGLHVGKPRTVDLRQVTSDQIMARIRLEFVHFNARDDGWDVLNQLVLRALMYGDVKTAVMRIGDAMECLRHLSYPETQKMAYAKIFARAVTQALADADSDAARRAIFETYKAALSVFDGVYVEPIDLSRWNLN